jgi:hypothetical protein
MSYPPSDPYRTNQPPDPPPKADGRAVASMVLGIVATALCCLPLVGIVCGPIAIVLYVKFSRDYNASGRRLGGRGMSIAGLVCGIVGCVIGAIYTIYWIAMAFFMGAAASGGLFSAFK